jgi:hypothetical protein
VAYEALMRPHFQLTRADVAGQAVVLLVHDTTEIDLPSHVIMSGLGQISNEKGRGGYCKRCWQFCQRRTLSWDVWHNARLSESPAPPKEQRYRCRHPRATRNGRLDAHG